MFKKYRNLIIITLFVLLLLPSQASAWTSNSSVITGLGLASQAPPVVYQKDGVWTLIAGEYWGAFFGFTWNGTAWVSNSSVITGLGNVGGRSSPEVYQKDGVWTLIAGETDGVFNGFTWNGTAWVSNSSVITGLGDVGSRSSPEVYQKDGVWTLIAGEFTGAFFGFTWNGTAWVSNSSVITGLGDVGIDSSPVVYQKDGVWTLIAGESDGVFNGFTWNGASWVSDSSVVSGLGDVGDYSDPTVYQKDGVWTLITQANSGAFNGFDIITYIPPIPVIGTVTTGNFWVNTGWSAGSGNVTNGYNSTNGTTWVNSTAASRNTTLSAHAWHNLTIYAWNSSGTGTLSATALTNNTQIPNNAISISGVSATYSINEGETLNIDANYTDVDSDTGTFSDNATQWNVNTGTGVVSWVTADGDQGTYNWQINVTDGYGSVSTQAFTVTVSDSTPTAPTGLTPTTGNFWINWTWSAGTNLDDYDVQINGTDTGSDTANLYYNDTYSAHATKTISVRSHNHTLNSYSAWVNDTTTIPNNAINISNVSSAYTLSEGELLSIYPTSSDADSDTPTYSTTATKGTFYTNNGTLLWTPTSGENGTYNWQINVTDGYGSTATKQFSVSVNSQTPGMPGNLAATTGNFWINYTWTTGVNTDTFNVSQNGTWTNGSAATFMNNTLSAHAWSNITVSGWNNTLKVVGNSTSLNTQVPNNAPTLGSSSISATSIYPVSQSLNVSVNNVNDTDNDNITGVTVGITYLGSETNYTMTNTANTTTWTYDFKTGVSGFYTVTAFYATDNYTATTKKTVSHAFEVVTQTSGGTSGGGGAVASTPTPTVTPATNITTPQGVEMISLPTIAQDPTGKLILEAMVVIGAVLTIFGLDKGAKIGTLLTGIVLIGASSWSLGWLV